MKRYTLYYIISLATMFFVACNSSLDGIVQEQPAMIGFGVDVDDTRSTIIQSSEDATFRAKAFRVFAEHTPEDGVPQDVFNDVDVKYGQRMALMYSEVIGLRQQSWRVVLLQRVRWYWSIR